MVLGTGLVSLGRRGVEFASAPWPNAPRLGPVRNPWNTDYTAGASLIKGSGALVAGADRARQRRRRLDPYSGRLQRVEVELKPSRGRLPAGAGVSQVTGEASSPIASDPHGTATPQPNFYEAERLWRNHQRRRSGRPQAQLSSG